MHECDRPTRWRELMNDAECKAWRNANGLEDEEDGWFPAASPAPLFDFEDVEDDGLSSDSIASYKDLIPTLVTLDDFLMASANSAASRRLLVVKFYSKRCRACLRIAAKYRRLAREVVDHVDCFEAEFSASRSLLQALDVGALPTVQIFIGEDVTRLYQCSCTVSAFPKVAAKVRFAADAMQSRRGLLLRLGEPLAGVLSAGGPVPFEDGAGI